MRGLHRLINYVRYASASKLVLISLVALVGIGAIVILSTNNNHPATAANCSDNDIIRCGISNGADFATQFKQNKKGDLPAIYAAYGLSADKVDDFAAHAVMGTANKDGTIMIGDTVVATDAHSLGRLQKNGDHPVTVGGNTYYDGANSTAFASDHLATLVLMNGDQFVSGVIVSCANPITGTPKQKTPPPPAPTPVATCDSLTAQLIGKAEDRTYKYKLDYTAKDGATLKTVDFDFGDGTTNEGVTPGRLDAIQHTYAKEGTYTTAATLHFSIGDKVKDVNCQVTIQVSANVPPPAPTPTPTPTPQPTSVPSTGPADVLTGALGMSSLSGAGYYWFRSRKHLVNKILGKD